MCVCSNGHEFSLDKISLIPSIPSEIPTNATTVSGIIIQTFNLPLHIILTFILQSIPFTNITV